MKWLIFSALMFGCGDAPANRLQAGCYAECDWSARCGGIFSDAAACKQQVCAGATKDNPDGCKNWTAITDCEIACYKAACSTDSNACLAACPDCQK
jgi:hypothetical protein